MNHSNGRKIQLIAGIVISAIQLVVTVVFMVSLHTVNVLPTSYKVLVGVLLGLFVLITLITQRWVVSGWITKVLAVLLSIIMIIGTVYINITYAAISDMSGVQEKKNVINVYVRADSDLESFEDIVNEEIGIGASLDRSHTDEAITYFEDKYHASISTVEFSSLTDVVDALYNGTVAAIILNESYTGILSETEGYASFDDETRVIASYEIIEKIVNNSSTDDSGLIACEDGHVFTLYVSGVDIEGSATGNRNADVNILVTVNLETNQILLLNTPRDYYVYQPYDGGVTDKLTHAGCAGVDVSIATLENLYEVDVTDYVKVNFTGFRSIIDALGGVDVYSEYEFTSTHGGFYFSQGMNRMNGEQALGFCRERYAFGTGDNQRGKNQMEVIKAVITKMESADMLMNYKNVLDSVSDSMVTSMTYDEIMELVQYQVENMSDWEIMTYAVTGHGDEQYCYRLGGNNYVMWPNEDTVQKAKDYMKAMYEDQRIVVE